MKIFKYLFVLLACFGQFFLVAQNNFVTLVNNGPGLGGEFRLNGQRWFAKMANYEVSIVYDEHTITNQNPNPEYFVAPAAHYGPNNTASACSFESLDKSSSLLQMRNDFELLAQNGFNSVRIFGALEFGRGYINGFPAFNAQSCRCNSGCCAWLIRKELIASPYTEMFGFIQDVLDQAAYAGLKVQFHTGYNSVPSIDDPIFSNTFYVPYLQALASHFANNSTLFSYDFRNEPATPQVPYSKGDICTLIESWHNAVDANSPHLTTIGFLPYNAGFTIKAWDPGFAKLDFISYHIYMEVDPGSINVPIGLNRVKNMIKWCAEVTEIPWMIGETSFAANDVVNPADPDDNGSEAEQASFAQNTMQDVRDWGGIGYGWWEFQDPRWQPNFGLYRWDQSPKPILSVFSNFNTTPSGTTPPTENNYYSFLMGGPYALCGTVVDQNSSPVENAIVEAQKIVVVGTVTTYPRTYVFTKADGTFTLSTQHNSGLYLSVQSVGGKNKVFTNVGAVSAGNLSNYSPCYIQIDKWLPIHSIPLNNIIVNNPTVYESANTIIVNQGTINSGISCNMKAGELVHLQSDFHADLTSEYHAYIGPMHASCVDVGSTFSRLINQSTTFTETITSLNENESPIEMRIYPNPADQTLNISFDSEIFNNYSVEIYDALGHLLKVIENRTSIDVGDILPGLYFFKFKSNDYEKTFKINIQH